MTPETENRSDSSKAGFGSKTLLEQLYHDLRNLAAMKLSRLPPGQTLQATALVHEAYLRLNNTTGPRWENERHFFASAAEAMRRILVDQARRKSALRHGGNIPHENLDDLQVSTPEPDDRILQVDEVLQDLEAEDPVRAQIVKLRFYAGLKHEEIANLLGLSEKTVRRHWALAKIWMHEKILVKTKDR